MGILSLIDPAYEKRSGGTPSPGDLYWVPTGYVSEVPRVLDVTRAGAEEHDRVAFQLTEIGNHHFRGGRQLPIKHLNLEGNEELLVAKAKRRPCVVVSSLRVGDTATLTHTAQRRMAERDVGRTLYLVAPAFTVASLLSPEKAFGPQLVARIRALQYPHLFCLPERDKATVPKSVVRLDLMFASYLGRACAPMEHRLSESATEVFLCAATIVLGGDPPALYTELQKIIAESGVPKT